MPIRTTIKVKTTETLKIGHEHDVIVLIGRLRQQSERLGMNSLNRTKLITAASELARNMLNYAGGGEVSVDEISQNERTGIRLVFSDQGPGIADSSLAMQDGYSTGSGLGLGLPGAKRLTNEFSLTSVVGQGTTVMVIKWTNG